MLYFALFIQLLVLLRVLWSSFSSSYLILVSLGFKVKLLKVRLDLNRGFSFWFVFFGRFYIDTTFSHKDIPPFFSFSVECVSWYWVGRSDWKKQNLKKINKKSRNRRPWYHRMTLKINIHIFGLTKYTIYCKKKFLFLFLFCLCCYYAHLSV